MYFKQLWYSINPRSYKNVWDRPWASFMFLTKTTVLATIILAILLLPQAITLDAYFDSKLSQFGQATLDGEFTTVQPIMIPDEQPWIVVDTTGKTKRTMEEIFINHDEVFIGSAKFDVDDFKDIKTNSETMGRFFLLLFLILFPAVIFWLGFVFWLKYVILALIVGIIGWLVLDLTRFRRPLKIVMCTSMHAIAVMIFVEMLFLAVNPAYLLPLVTVWRVSLYAVTTLAYLLMFVLATVFNP